MSWSAWLLSFEKRHIKQQPSSLSDQFQLRERSAALCQKARTGRVSYEAIEKGYLDHLKPKHKL
ncbi:hypothetical protein [Streptococcus equi]|uniref:hypothetical protein n=1 Tax=Streptococcus equi TaxID=1336 RepID=UPI001E4EBDFC|nr:hypothetical protein [Streptococcus equi]